VEKEMNKKLPETDSIEELAEFWDTHDLTDFEDQLEQVTEPVFQRDTETMALTILLWSRGGCSKSSIPLESRNRSAHSSFPGGVAPGAELYMPFLH
jgi:hypothetical protein